MLLSRFSRVFSHSFLPSDAVHVCRQDHLHFVVRNSSVGSLVMVRQPESVMGRTGEMVGWVDSPLSDKGQLTAVMTGIVIHNHGINIDVAFASHMKRSIKTAWHLLEQSDCCNATLFRKWQLNERHLGALQGLNRAIAEQNFGVDAVQKWLEWRSDEAVTQIPPCSASSPHSGAHHPLYSPSSVKMITDRDLSEHLSHIRSVRTESINDVIKRTVSCWNDSIAPCLLAGNNVLLVMHRTPMVALLHHIECTTGSGTMNEQPHASEVQVAISSINFPRGVPLLYNFDALLRPIPVQRPASAYSSGAGLTVAPLSGIFLGHPESLRMKLNELHQDVVD